MEQPKIEKIQHFLDDKMMADSVFEVLMATFQKPRATRSEYPDVNFLAAERIAADLLIEGWKELKTYRRKDERPPTTGNPGL